MKRLLFALAAGSAVACASATTLFGVGRSGTNHTFFSINTTTGTPTALFNFGLPSNVTGVYGLTYIPSTDRFLTVGVINANQGALIEIDANTQSASPVALSISGFPYYEGIEYSAALNSVVLAVGPGSFFSGSLAFLNPVGYGVQSTNVSTTLPDSDILFSDSAGALNVLDANNPAPNGFMRNLVNNPTGPSTLTGVGSNFWSVGNPVQDLAYKSDNGILYSTTMGQLYAVNGASTAMAAVGGPYATAGFAVEMKGITEAVPEPGTVAALALGLAALASRRRRSQRA